MAPSASNAELNEGDFSRFDISKTLIKRLQKRGILELFPVQQKTFDLVITGKDAVVLARTGTGKTLAFTLPIVQRLLNEKSITSRGRPPRVIVLAPTRELVSQIATDFQSVVENDLTVLSVYGGVPLGPQCHALRSGVDVIIGAPGRVLDLIGRNVLDLSSIQHVVLDEVDRMLDMGFSKDVESIFSSVYRPNSPGDNPQTLLFSATLPTWVTSVAKKYLSDDVHHVSLVDKQKNKTALNVQHCMLPCPYQERASTISDVIRVYCKQKESRCVVFCERKRDADELAAHAAMSDDCHVFHGDVPQEKRELVLQKFRDGKYRTLITTNVAARGLDVPSVDLVIQCHPPSSVEDYIHRSGRTGRAERTGTSIVFYTPRERDMLAQIEREAGVKFKRIAAPTMQDIMSSLDEELVKSFLVVPHATWSAFIPSAESLVRRLQKDPNGAKDINKKQKGKALKSSSESFDSDSGTKISRQILLQALCCALARLSGKDGKIESRSLLSAQKGFTTYRLDIDCIAERKGMAYAYLREQLPDEITENIRNLSYLKGRTGFVFDLTSTFDTKVSSSWSNEMSECKLNVLHELPELEEEEKHVQNWSQRGGNWGGRQGHLSKSYFSEGNANRNGLSFGFNRGQSGRGRPGMKRNWNSAGGRGFPKKTKFDTSS